MLAATPAIRGCEPFARDQLMLKSDVHGAPHIVGFSLAGLMEWPASSEIDHISELN